MTCGYCQFSNSDSDHRCGRCGRRLSQLSAGSTGRRSPENVRLEVQSQGANALAAVAVTDAVPARGPLVAVEPSRSAESLRRPTAAREPAPSRTQRAAQPSLFGAELQPKIIPFESSGRVAELPPESLPSVEATRTATAAPRRAASRPSTRRNAHPDDSQGALEFLPPLRNAGRTLKTNAEAVIFCDAKVAAPLHRATATALDLTMVLVAFGAVAALFQVWGEPSKFDRLTLASLGAMLGLVGLLYGLVFAGFGAVTPGMKWTHLRLITFDGFPLEPRARALRFFGAWVSVLSGGIGLLWALLDEENLTWHDHMSKTFPALRESDSTVVRQSLR